MPKPKREPTEEEIALVRAFDCKRTEHEWTPLYNGLDLPSAFVCNRCKQRVEVVHVAEESEFATNTD